MVQIKLKSHNKESLVLYKAFIIKILKNFNVSYRHVDLPISKKKLTILKSPHVYKSAREQFMLKTYKTFILVDTKISLNKLKRLIINKPKTIKINIKY